MDSVFCLDASFCFNTSLWSSAAGSTFAYIFLFGRAEVFVENSNLAMMGILSPFNALFHLICLTCNFEEVFQK